MIISLLVWGVLIAALSRRRKSVALIYAVAILGHELFLVDLPGFWYYFSDAVLCLLIISTLYLVNPVTQISMALQKICMSAIICDAVGWIMWYNYLSPDWYNLSFVLIYTCAIWSILTKDGFYYVGHTRGSRGVVSFFSRHIARLFGCKRVEG